MKHILICAMWAAVCVAPACATVNLSLDAPLETLSGNPGDMLVFYGEVDNDTPDPISLDYPAFFQVGGTLDSSSYNLDYGWPDSVDANSITGSVDLFSVTIPMTAAPGPYGGTLELDGYYSDDTPYTSTLDFTVDVLGASAAPEPAETIPCALAFLGIVAYVMRRRRRSQA